MLLEAAVALFATFNWRRFSIIVISEGSWEWMAQALNEHIEVLLKEMRPIVASPTPPSLFICVTVCVCEGGGGGDDVRVYT